MKIQTVKCTFTDNEDDEDEYNDDDINSFIESKTLDLFNTKKILRSSDVNSENDCIFSYDSDNDDNNTEIDKTNLNSDNKNANDSNTDNENDSENENDSDNENDDENDSDNDENDDENDSDNDDENDSDNDDENDAESDSNNNDDNDENNTSNNTENLGCDDGCCKEHKIIFDENENEEQEEDSVDNSFVLFLQKFCDSSGSLELQNSRRTL